MYYIFQFDKWHLNSLERRKYAQDIIVYVNSERGISHNSVVEIGCGLGDIIRNINYSRRLGYDLDNNVLRAARFLSKMSFNGAIDFGVFNFPETPLVEKFDVIIMVNWIHNIAPDVLKSAIEKYFHDNLNGIGEIVIDTVGHANYQYNHSIDHLTSNIKCTKEKIGEYENNRCLYTIKRNE